MKINKQIMNIYERFKNTPILMLLFKIFERYQNNPMGGRQIFSSDDAGINGYFVGKSSLFLPHIIHTKNSDAS